MYLHNVSTTLHFRYNVITVITVINDSLNHLSKLQTYLFILFIYLICLIANIRNKIELQHVYILEMNSVRKGIKN